MKPSKCLSLRENADTTKRVSAPPAFVSRLVDFFEPVGNALLGLGTLTDLTVHSGCAQAAHPEWATFSVGY